MTEVERKLTALVVDDDKAVRETLVEILSSIPPLEVQTAIDGKDAYNKIKEQKPDVLYTDIIMPKMWGDSLLKELVENGIKIPTLIITSSAENTEGAIAIFYSHRMYTTEQRDELQLSTQLNIHDQEAHIKRIMREQEESYIEARLKASIEGRSMSPPKYDIDFTVITKPFDYKVIADRTKTILEKVYKIPYITQS